MQFLQKALLHLRQSRTAFANIMCARWTWVNDTTFPSLGSNNHCLQSILHSPPFSCQSGTDFHKNFHSKSTSSHLWSHARYDRINVFPKGLSFSILATILQTSLAFFDSLPLRSIIVLSRFLNQNIVRSSLQSDSKPKHRSSNPFWSEAAETLYGKINSLP